MRLAKQTPFREITEGQGTASGESLVRPGRDSRRRNSGKELWVRRLLRCPHCERDFVLRLVADGPYNIVLEVTRDGVVATPVSQDGVIAEGKRVVLADVAAAGAQSELYPLDRGFDDDEAPWPVSPAK